MALKAVQKDVDQVSKRIEMLHHIARGWISNDATHTQVQTAEDYITSVVLNEGNYFMASVQLCDILYVVVDHCVLQALSSIIKDLCVYRDVFKRHLSSSVDMSLIAWHVKELLHLLIDTWKENDILSSIFEHLLTQRSDSMPESFILFHLLGNFFLLSVLNFIPEVLL